jgi:AcrR family transcriptional regulator
MSSAEPLTPERRRALTREHLLEAAAAVFGEKGYERASLDEIAKRAGFTKGAVYSNFANKEDLFLELTNDRNAAMMQNFFAAAPNADDVTDVFRRLAPTPEEWMLYEEFVLYAQRKPELRERLRRENAERFERLVELVAASLPPDASVPARDLAHIYAALFDGLSRQRALDPAQISDDLFARLLEYIAP